MAPLPRAPVRLTARTTLLLLFATFAALASLRPLAAEETLALSTCQRLIAEQPLDWRPFRCVFDFARTSGRSVEAERLLRRAVADDPENPHPRYFLGLLLADEERDEATIWMRSAAELYQERGSPTGEAMTRISLLFTLVGAGRVDAAKDEHNRLLDAARASGSRSLLLSAEIEGARLAITSGDYGRAERRLRELETDVFSEPAPAVQAAWLGLLGLTEWGTGRFAAARETFRRQAELLAAAGDSYEESVARANLAFVTDLDATVDLEERRRLAREAMEVADRSGNRGMRASARVRLASMLDGEGASPLVEEALSLARNPATLRQMARLMRYTSELPKAIAFAEEALELSGETWHRAEEASCLYLLAELYWLAGDRTAAVSYALTGLDALEELRATQTPDEARTRSFAQWVFPFRTLAGHLLAGDLRSPDYLPTADDLALAHLVLERNRARDLLDLLALENRSSDIDSEVRELRREISRVQRQLMLPHLSTSRRHDLEEQLTVLELREEDIRTGELEPTHPIQLVQAPELRALLEPDEAVLVYQIAPSQYRYGFAGASWLLAMTHGDMRVFRLAESETLQAAASLYLGLIEGGDTALEEHAAGRLFQQLLAPALETLPAEVRRLVVVPDGFLNRVPFAAFLQHASGGPYETTLTPSLTTWVQLRRMPVSRKPRPALVFADPTAAATSSPTSAAGVRSWDLSRSVELGALPQARREARIVAGAFGSGTRVLVGEEASEAALLGATLGRYGLLHFAAHAVIDEARPERSAVVLASAGPDEDGLLQEREIRDLRFDGQVVVLASCRSAAGPILGGEGALGLSRAFLAAGSSVVVGTLWPLRESDAVPFFSSFYRHLAEGESVAAAVAAAQRRAVAQGRPTSAWAGVVVHGDGGRAPLAREPTPWKAIGVGLVILASLVLVATLLRASQRGRRAALKRPSRRGDR